MSVSVQMNGVMSPQISRLFVKTETIPILDSLGSLGIVTQVSGNNSRRLWSVSILDKTISTYPADETTKIHLFSLFSHSDYRVR